MNELLEGLSADVRKSVEDFAAKENCAVLEAVRRALLRGLDELAVPTTRRPSGSTQSDALLPSRQRQVLRALRRGLAVKEIAGELGISEATVRTHVLRLRQRLEYQDLLSLRMPGDAR